MICGNDWEPADNGVDSSSSGLVHGDEGAWRELSGLAGSGTLYFSQMSGLVTMARDSQSRTCSDFDFGLIGGWMTCGDDRELMDRGAGSSSSALM